MECPIKEETKDKRDTYFWSLYLKFHDVAVVWREMSPPSFAPSFNHESRLGSASWQWAGDTSGSPVHCYSIGRQPTHDMLTVPSHGHDYRNKLALSPGAVLYCKKWIGNCTELKASWVWPIQSSPASGLTWGTTSTLPVGVDYASSMLLYIYIWHTIVMSCQMIKCWMYRIRKAHVSPKKNKNICLMLN